MLKQRSIIKVTVGNKKKYKTIHKAAKEGNLAEVKRHLGKGVRIDARDKDGRTPLMWAARHLEVVKYLLKKGADVNTREKYGWTPLMWAACKGNLDVVKMLLRKGADVDAKDNEGKTPLMGAAFKGNHDVVILLVAKGADVNARGNGPNGWTPLTCASYNDDLGMIEFLMAKSCRAAR